MPPFASKEEAVGAVGEVLSISRTAALEELGKADSLIAAIVNPDKLPPEELRSKGLTEETIKKLLDQLRADGVAKSYQM